MLIPFLMLLMITIALILERKYHEDKISDIYKDKLENWKKHNSNNEKEKCKELVGLVFLEDEMLNIQMLDDKIQDRLERKKYKIS